MASGRRCCKVVTVSLVPTTVFILSVTFFAGFIALPTLYTELSHKEQYAIVIDAGSSHSEVFLYSWQLPYYNKTGLVSQNSYCLDQTKGGISSYTDDPSGAGDSLKGCLTGILRKVPSSINNPSSGHKVKLWLGATAGMRLLKRENETLSEDILDSVKETVSDSTHSHVKILSGQEEALGGWITTNYVNGNFEKQYPFKRDVSSNTVGALDMGGASMQISYATPLSANHTRSVTIFDTTHTVYARSFLCYGINEAKRRIMAYSVMESNFSNVVENPCIHKGNTISHNASFLFGEHFCTKLLNTDNVPDNTDFNITGTSNTAECLKLVKRAMNFSTNISSEETQEFDTPQPSGSFLGFSNFYYITNFYNFGSFNSSSLSSFKDSVNTYCSLTWEEVNSQYNNLYRAFYCVDGIFLYHTFTNGLGFTDNNMNWSINFTKQVNGLLIGWSLGYMLQESHTLISSPYYTHYPYTTVDLIVGMVVLTLLCLVFVIFFAFTFSACRKSLHPVKGSYTSIS